MLGGGAADKTWIVSDLTSKIAFQNEMFTELTIIPDESLLRAQELWTLLIKRLRGDLRFVSSETAGIYAKQILESSDIDWHQRPGVSQLVLNYLHMLIPVLSHEENSEAIKDFFKNNLESFNKWGHWYLLAKDIFEKFKDDKMILASWASAVLVNEVGYEDVWKRKLVFDLGGQLQPIESELILHLSKFLEVDVIVPHPSWKEEYAKALKSYDILITKKPPPIEPSSSETHSFMKFTTQLAEVQNICGLVRKSISEGSSPKTIAVCAPDIGVYWPVLCEYLKTEGIPYQRKVQTPLKTFPEIMNWLSRLRVEAGLIEYSDIETNIFTDTSDLENESIGIPIAYSSFQSLYANLYDSSDISRDKKVANQFTLKPEQGRKSLNEFLKWSLTFWKSSWSQDRLSSLVDKLYSDVPGWLRFDTQTWISLLDSFAAKLEVTTDEGFPDGIHCIDLVSLKDLSVSNVFLMGLTDKALRSVSTTLISDADIERLKLDYGFVIAEPERTELEFEVKWNLENPTPKFVLAYPQTNFDGEQMSPSVVWLTGALEQYGEKIPVQLVHDSRFAQIQNSSYESIAQIRAWPDQAEKLQRIREDLGLETQLWSLEGHVEKISASQIEDYLKCPFINASKKIFALVDLPDIDLDIDYLTRGKLLHGVAELIYRKHPNLDLESSQIPLLFEQVMTEIDTPIFDRNIWEGQKSKYIKMIENFIQFEREWRSKYTAVTQVLHEQSFSLFVDISTGEICKTASKNTVEFRGRIDRIEIDQKDKTCVVVDYKFSSDSYSNHNKWIENNELQLALYSLAIERGALDQPYEVAGAVYYGFKNLGRSRGMLVTGAEEGMFEINPRGGAKIDLNKKNAVYKAATEAIQKALTGMIASEYNPNPSDPSDCKSCYWRTLCRAPHLS